MPIDLQNMNALNTSAVNSGPKHPPKKHHKVLTGTGGKIGILSEARNPFNNKDIAINASMSLNYRKKHVIAAGLEKDIIPVSLYREEVHPSIRKLPETACDITDATSTVEHVFLHVLPHDLEITAKMSDRTAGKQVYVNYIVDLYVQRDPNEETYVKREDIFGAGGSNFYARTYASDLVSFFSCNPFANYTSYADGAKVDDYLRNYSLYDGVCDALDDTYDGMIDYVRDIIRSGSMTLLRATLISMEYFGFSIEDYSNLYTMMEQEMRPDEIDAVKECNTNLMTVSALQALKGQKQFLTTFRNQPLNPNIKQKYSPLQEQAIIDNDPLILVQSGAGTGKSTVVLGRINHMLDCGVNIKDIIVLSFTNAAADHISELYPGIHSMTIASMVHTIYSANFPTHVLSSENTLYNILEAAVKRTPERDQLCRYLKKGDRMGISDFTAFYNFVAANYNEVIQMLSDVQQTTLLLEVLICAIDMQNIRIPNEVTCKHMIIDEVQDNSMFEFIYMLKYAAYNHNSLFIVGDCSQTLYEFRLANPGTLNTLEASGIFSTHVLDINYRSTQAILDFANIMLSNIEANRYANIQLHANSLAKVDYNTFINTVQCNYTQLKKKTDLSDALPGIFAGKELSDFIKNALANNEKIAILSYARATAARCKDIMEIQFPNASCASACARVTYDITILSNYVANHWNNAKYFNEASFLQELHQDLVKNYSNANAISAQDVRNRETIQKFCQEVQYDAISWYNMYHTGLLTKTEFLNKFKQALVDFEIKNNTYRRRITSSINKREKESDDIANANIIVSTVHSVKGLEFDKCIVIYDDDAQDEASKRLYYVALTRAMKGEFILGYGTKKYSMIMDWYNHIANALNPNFVSQNVNVSIADGSMTLDPPIVVDENGTLANSI